MRRKYGGAIYLHQFHSEDVTPLLEYLGNVVKRNYTDSNFVPNYVLMASFIKVATVRKVENTFQLLLVSDGYDTYVIMNFVELGGTGLTGYNDPNCKRNELKKRKNLLTTSNTGYMGQHVFKLTDPSCIKTTPGSSTTKETTTTNEETTQAAKETTKAPQKTTVSKKETTGPAKAITKPLLKMTTTNDETTARHKTKTGDQTSENKATIGGAAAGGVVGFFIIIVIVFVLVKRRRGGKSSKGKKGKGATFSDDAGTYENPAYESVDNIKRNGKT